MERPTGVPVQNKPPIMMWGGRRAADTYDGPIAAADYGRRGAAAGKPETANPACV